VAAAAGQLSGAGRIELLPLEEVTHGHSACLMADG